MSADQQTSISGIIKAIISLVVPLLACAVLLSEFKPPEPYRTIEDIVCFLILGFPLVVICYGAVFSKKKKDE